MKSPVPPAGDAPQEARSPGAIPAEALIAALAMGALVAITAVNVVVRYFTDRSFAWTEEVSVYLMVAMTLAGSAVAAARDQHIRVTAVCEGGSDLRRYRLALLSAGASTLLFALLAVLLAWLVRDEFLLDETSAALGLPRWWYTASLAVLAVALALRSAIWGLHRARRAA